jgi:two-component system LytT family response regulator
MKMRAVIVDDEAHARNTLRAMLEIYAPEIEVIAEAHDVLGALKAIKEVQPDVLFLDINLGSGSGFDVLQLTPDPGLLKVIFVTAYEEYAIKAFKFSALDYLVKPVLPDELISACQKICKNTTRGVNKFQVEVAGNILNSEAGNKKIVLKTSEAMHLVPLDEIIHCKSDDNYTQFQLTGNRSILVSRTLREFEELLSPSGFARVHNSHLINQNHILFFDKRDGGFIVMRDEARIPVSSRKKELVVQLIQNMENI